MPIRRKPKGPGGGQFMPGERCEQVESDVQIQLEAAREGFARIPDGGVGEEAASNTLMALTAFRDNASAGLYDVQLDEEIGRVTSMLRDERAESEPVKELLQEILVALEGRRT